MLMKKIFKILRYLFFGLSFLFELHLNALTFLKFLFYKSNKLKVFYEPILAIYLYVKLKNIYSRYRTSFSFVGIEFN